MGFDLAAYLARIGVHTEAPTLTEVHRGHVQSIAFENLDPHAGQPVSLDPAVLFDKLVTRRRGGYCFEHNRLLGLAYTALGAEVEPMLARVRWNAPPGAVRPLAHLVLHVRQGEDAWLADAGFGAGTLLEPIPFGPGGPYHQAGWGFRIVEEGPRLVLQGTAPGGAWGDIYAFEPTPVPEIDIAVSNWFTATNPLTPFVSGLMIGAQAADGARLWLRGWPDAHFGIERPEGAEVRPVSAEEVPTLLERHFGLPGVSLARDGHLIPPAASAP